MAHCLSCRKARNVVPTSFQRDTKTVKREESEQADSDREKKKNNNNHKMNKKTREKANTKQDVSFPSSINIK